MAIDDDRLTDDDRTMIAKVAREFRVTDTMAYYRARDLRLLSYQVAEDNAAYMANMRVIMASAIADGFSDGNEQFPEASEIMKTKYLSAADAVLKELQSLQAASTKEQTP